MSAQTGAGVKPVRDLACVCVLVAPFENPYITELLSRFKFPAADSRTTATFDSAPAQRVIQKRPFRPLAVRLFPSFIHFILPLSLFQRDPPIS